MTRLLGGLCLCLAVVLFSSGASRAADKKDVEAAQKDVAELIKLVEGGKDAKTIVAKVDAIKKNHDLDSVMSVFKLKEKGGMGYDADPKMGLELKIQRMDKGNNPVPAKVLKDESDKMLKLAYVSIAMADLAKPYFTKAVKGKGKKDWDKHCDDQKKTAEDLITAVKAGDGKAAKAAFKALNNSCLGCHSDFR